jgi:EF-P beta-lysylation protein EpmB
VNVLPLPILDPLAPPAGDWHAGLRTAIRDPDRLLELLQLGEEFRAPAHRAARLFPLFVTRSFVGRMRPGDPRDPLLLQVLPLGAEEAEVAGFGTDAVGDAAARRAPGMLQKYAGRALLIAHGACAIHCRYCFRRHYPYSAEPQRLADWEPALAVLAGDPSVKEAILSGGDPLMLTDRRLGELLARLDGIPHLKRLRIHSRLPIVLPERVTAELLDMLAGLRVTPFVVVHANHPQELEGRCGEVLRQMVRAGLTVLNQAVLLKGINDDVDVLERLSLELVDRGVLPYYLNQLDRVAGTAHFEVPVETGCRLIAELRRRLPGYAVPQYVQEIAGAPHKVPLC